MERSYGLGNFTDIVLWAVFVAIMLLYLWAMLMSDAGRVAPEPQVAPVKALEPLPRPAGQPMPMLV